jgi:hypothetical protein
LTEPGELLKAVAPWLTDFGSWIFGALIGFDLVILGAILTIGPVDDAVNIATAAVALALPPGALGLVLLRVVTDVRNIRRSRTGAEAAAQSPSMVVLRYTVGLMLVTILLTLVGVTASLWHMAWWIAVAFVVMLGLSVAVFVIAAVQLRARG